MSVESCTAFLERTQEDPDLGRVMRSLTDTREFIALARRSGYTFDLQDLMSASSARAAQDPTPHEPEAGPPATDGETAICHYELDLRDVSELGPVLDELPSLTIRPATVDLDRFAATLRPDDLEWTSMSPAAAEFRPRYEEIMAAHWNGGPGGPGGDERRDFHLVNLDQHVDHSLYDGYFEAKLRTVGHLERIFGPDLRFSGSMWYPPYSYRLWHTNETQPGWRMYLLDFDETIPDDDTRSFFRYMNPQTKELVTLRDRPAMLRFFKVDQRDDRLFWHCIVNGAPRNRWSFGFAISDDWMTRLRAAVSVDLDHVLKVG
jgi:predicted ribosomally synthesized peptide with nif11-like leader